MRKEIQKQKKGNRGITLVALVVTIVVLLILAGITISTLFGDNGIISAARKAADDTKKGEEDTEKGIENLVQDMNNAITGGIVEPKNVEDWEWELDEITNTIKITKYSGEDTVVIIPNHIGGVKVKSIGTNTGGVSLYSNLWDDKRCSNTGQTYGNFQETIEKVIISEGIESINWCCFGNSKALKEITIPSSVTTISYKAFIGCTRLTNITIPNGITSIEEGAFANCTSLTNITIPSSVTTMGRGVFYSIPSITVTVPFSLSGWNGWPSGWDSSWNSTNSNCTVRVKDQQANYYQ